MCWKSVKAADINVTTLPMNATVNLRKLKNKNRKKKYFYARNQKKVTNWELGETTEEDQEEVLMNCKQ